MRLSLSRSTRRSRPAHTALRIYYLYSTSWHGAFKSQVQPLGPSPPPAPGTRRNGKARSRAEPRTVCLKHTTGRRAWSQHTPLSHPVLVFLDLVHVRCQRVSQLRLRRFGFGTRRPHT
eukprot:5208149-Prymnesium_polylepis.1